MDRNDYKDFLEECPFDLTPDERFLRFPGAEERPDFIPVEADLSRLLGMWLRSAWELNWGWEMLGYRNFLAIQEAIFIKQRIAKLQAVVESERFDLSVKDAAETFRRSKSDADWRIFTEGTRKEKNALLKVMKQV